MMKLRTSLALGAPTETAAAFSASSLKSISLPTCLHVSGKMVCTPAPRLKALLLSSGIAAESRFSKFTWNSMLISLPAAAPASSFSSGSMFRLWHRSESVRNRVLIAGKSPNILSTSDATLLKGKTSYFLGSVQ